MSVSTVLDPAAARAERSTGRLLVTWQDPREGSFHPLGFLESYGQEWSFAYLHRAVIADWFTPLLGFPAVGRKYVSRQLFPLFDQRVIDPRRSDRPGYLEALGLREDATAFEVLGRSGGQRAGDTLELIPVPTVQPDGKVCLVFLVHGVRHQPGAAERIDSLEAGDPLCLIEEPENPKDSRALVVAEDHETRLGWVPSGLLDFVHELKLSGDYELTVERANGSDVGPHLRLLVRLTGHYPIGMVPFTGRRWRIAESQTDVAPSAG